MNSNKKEKNKNNLNHTKAVKINDNNSFRNSVNLKNKGTAKKGYDLKLKGKSKSNNNMNTNCSINKNTENNSNKNIHNNINFKYLSSKKSDLRKSLLKKEPFTTKKKTHKFPSLKNLYKKSKNSTKEINELKEQFKDYLNDINKNTFDSMINLNLDKFDNEEKYRNIYSLIKTENSIDSDEMSLEDDNEQINLEGELENNFLFSFDNGRLLKWYKDFQFIGKGGFGVVFKATNKIDESQCAIKIMKINLDLKEEKEDLKVTQEIKTMLKFKNKNIVRYKTCWFETTEKKNYKKKAKSNVC
jgi:hypothetical protein